MPGHARHIAGVPGLLVVLILAAWWSGGCIQSGLPLDIPSATAPVTALPSPHDVWPGVVMTIGRSQQGRPLEAYTTGEGPVHVVFVGGIHGGYEWNSVLLAHQFLDHVTSLPDLLPDALTLTIIPVANPDGLAKIIGHAGRFTPAAVAGETTSGRFNANGVDLNRNWDCHWRATATWRDVTVSGGRAPFSEPETRALRDFFLAVEPTAVVFWHSAAPGVFAAGCDQAMPESMVLARVYAEAAGYLTASTFTAYAVTGDAGDWLASQGVPSISVELTNRTETDWEQNLRGVQALLAYLRDGL